MLEIRKRTKFWDVASFVLTNNQRFASINKRLPSRKGRRYRTGRGFFAIFDAARTLREKIVRLILPKTEIPSIEDADILFTLYLAELHHKKQVPPSSKEITPVKLRAQENSIYATPDTEGYYLVKEVRKSLVYKQSGLSRRLSQLAKNHQIAGKIRNRPPR